MTPIYAEASADRQTLILMAAGDDPHAIATSAKRLELLTPLFSKSDPPGALTTPLTWATCVQLSAMFGRYWKPLPGLQAWIAEETARRTTPIEYPQLAKDVIGALPEGLTPRPYQVDGALEIARTGRALIFDEPRTGKTITTILGLAQMAFSVTSMGQHRMPILVICPASVVDPWVEAFGNWAPYWRAVAWRGPKRKALAGTADVYVTSYDTARQDATVVRGFQELIKLGAKTLVVDECHYIKNPQAERTKAVRRLAKNTEAFVALSGTPITTHTGELWAVLDCLAPGAFPSRSRWVSRYCLSVPGEYDDEIIGLHPATEAEFRVSILGQHRRVARADVMADLPPKVYSVRTVDLPVDWRKAYDDFEDQLYAELPPTDSGEAQELAVMDVLSKFTHLSGLASAPADVEVTYGPDTYPEGHPQEGEEKRHISLKLKGPSWKVDALLEILGERCGKDIEPEDREAVVCFAPSAQLMRLAGAEAAKAGYRVGYIIGGQSAGDRTEAIRAFQAGELDLICATTGAGGEGVTLSRAGTLVFLQRPWKLTQSIQAEDRGEGDMEATRGTEIIDVVARNTIESRIRAALREKAGQLSELLQDPRLVTELLGGARTKEAA
jgi:SNF2 family DNA or RNA helicase